LESRIFDENAPATYKWLSQSQSLSSNVAKRVLFEFATANEDRVEALYLVCGIAKPGSSKHRVVKLVSKQDLDSTKSDLESVSTVHVYSCQTKIPSEYSQLAVVDSEEFQTAMSNNRSDVIKNRWSAVTLKQPFELRGNLRPSKPVDAKDSTPAVAPKKSTPVSLGNPMKSSGPFGKSSVGTSKPSTNSSSKKPTQKSFSFGKAKPKPVSKPVAQPKSNVDDEDELVSGRKKRRRQVVMSDDEDEVSEDEEMAQLDQEAAMEASLAGEEEVQPPQDETGAEPEPPSTQGNTAVEDEDTDGTPANEPEASKASMQQTTISAATVSSEKRKKRVKVSKTYMQGKYMVTEDVWEEVTDDESEPTSQPVKEKSPAKQKSPAKKAQQPQKVEKPKSSKPEAKKAKGGGKQAGIMGFFGKKKA